MSLNTQQMTELVEQGQVDQCVAFFAHASESDRQSVAKLAEKWLRKITEFVQTGDSFGMKGTREQLEAGRVAAFAACSFSTIKSLGWRISPVDDPVVRVLAARQPKWIDEYAEHLLEGDPPQWLAVRQLMKGRLCSKPKHENYVLGMTHLWAGVGGSATDPTEHQGRTWSKWNIVSHLEAEPDLLEDVWRLSEARFVRSQRNPFHINEFEIRVGPGFTVFVFRTPSDPRVHSAECFGLDSEWRRIRHSCQMLR